MKNDLTERFKMSDIHEVFLLYISETKRLNPKSPIKNES